MDRELGNVIIFLVNLTIIVNLIKLSKYFLNLEYEGV